MPRPDGRAETLRTALAGNLLNDGVHSYAYDAENRTIRVDGGASVYVYDAEGRRTSKTTGGVTVDYLYDRAGHQVVELTSGGTVNRQEIYAGGMHLATYKTGTTYFHHSDWLGTERARSNMSVMACETIISLPFGDGQATAGNCGDSSPMHFTGKERDSESSLDMFGARYYASTMGRFMIPDWSSKPAAVPFADPANPQSLNLYSYVANNPLSRIDPLGHNWFQIDGKWQWHKGGSWTGANGTKYKQLHRTSGCAGQRNR